MERNGSIVWLQIARASERTSVYRGPFEREWHGRFGLEERGRGGLKGRSYETAAHFVSRPGEKNRPFAKNVGEEIRPPGQEKRREPGH